MIFPFKICTIKGNDLITGKEVTRNKLIYIHKWYNEESAYFKIEYNTFKYKGKNDIQKR